MMLPFVSTENAVPVLPPEKRDRLNEQECIYLMNIFYIACRELISNAL